MCLSLKFPILTRQGGIILVEREGRLGGMGVTNSIAKEGRDHWSKSRVYSSSFI